MMKVTWSFRLSPIVTTDSVSKTIDGFVTPRLLFLSKLDVQKRPAIQPLDLHAVAATDSGHGSVGVSGSCWAQSHLPTGFQLRQGGRDADGPAG